MSNFIRSVIDNEVGGEFQSGLPFNAYGCFIGSPTPGSLAPEAIEVIYGKFDKFSPSQDTATRGFPYSKLKQFEANGIAVGQPPIYVTSGKSPVYFAWSLKLDANNVPTAPTQDWEQAVNVADPRFVAFWLNEYAVPVLSGVKTSLKLPLMPWIEADEGAFNYQLFGPVVNGKFVPGAVWDKPFPQNDNEYLVMVGSFFAQLQALNSGINVMVDLGSLSQPGKFSSVFAGCPGVMVEDIYGWHIHPIASNREAWFQQQLTNLPWLGSQGKVAVCRAILPVGDPAALLNSFCTYELVKGPNFFFAPGSPTNVNVPPASWAQWLASLGKPIAAGSSSATPLQGMQPGYRSYMRLYEGGIVYLNLTGAPVVELLDQRYKHYDEDGNAITSLTIPDLAGRFTSFETNNLPMPRISPRSGLAAKIGPITITDDNAEAKIYWTTDGTEPTQASTEYGGPIGINLSGKMLKARAFLKGYNPSWSAVAQY